MKNCQMDCPHPLMARTTPPRWSVGPPGVASPAMMTSVRPSPSTSGRAGADEDLGLAVAVRIGGGRRRVHRAGCRLRPATDRCAVVGAQGVHLVIGGTDDDRAGAVEGRDDRR